MGTIIWRCLRLRCPACGRGRLFRGWFRMHAKCDGCGMKFEREPGYFLGSIYFNYGVTALLVIGLYLGLWLGDVATPEQLLVSLTVFSVIFPLIFFRWSRALWMALDHFYDPPQKNK